MPLGSKSPLIGASDFKIDYDGAYHQIHDLRYLQQRKRGDLSAVSLTDVIEDAIAETGDAIVLFLGPQCDGTGKTLTIKQGRVSIATGINRSGAGAWVTPRIDTVILDTNDAEMKENYMQGLHIRELQINARNSHLIEQFEFEQCEFKPVTDTYRGIVFMGNHHILNGKFTKCHIDNAKDQRQAENPVSGKYNDGAITMENTSDGTGQIDFDGLTVRNNGHYRTLMAWKNGGWTGPTVWFDRLNVESVTRDGVKIFHVNAGGKCASLEVINGYFEITGQSDIFTIDDGELATLMRADFSHNKITLGAIGKDVRMMNNTCVVGNFYSSARSYVMGAFNKISAPTGGGVFTDGVIGRNARFMYDMGYRYSVALVEYPHLHKTLESGGNYDNLATNGTDEYVPVIYLASKQADPTLRYIVRNYDVIYRHMRAVLSAAPGAGKSRTLDLYVNGAGQALTVTISNTDTEGTDWINEVKVTKGLPHCWRSDGGVGTPAVSMVKIGVEMLWQECEE